MEDTHVSRTWLPRMDFPVFEGSDARVWIDKCESYFALYQIPVNLHVTSASLHMRDRAAHWFQSHKAMVGVLDWDQFKLAVCEEFEQHTHQDKMLELLTLKQTGAVEDYRTQFEQLVYHVKLFDKSISDTFLVTQFVLGLKHDLRALVEIQFPTTVSKAAQLALKHESLLSRTTKSSVRSYQPRVESVGM